MRIILLVTIALIAATLLASAQSLSIFDIDTTQFPLMGAKFYAFDASGQQIRPSASEVSIVEDGISRTVLSVTCPPQQPIMPVSLAMSIDVSGSMSNSRTTGEIPIELGKITVRELVPLISNASSEFALQTCDVQPVVVQDFTTNKGKILSALGTLVASGGNDFAEHLLNPLTGLLNIAKTGKHKRVAILYTDAWWDALPDSVLQRCKSTCATYGIEFYAIIYTRHEVQPNGIKASLRTLAEATGGAMFDGVTSPEAAKAIAVRLRQQAEGGLPCNITWQSGDLCVASQRNVSLKWTTQTAQASYALSVGAVSHLEFNPLSIFFTSKPVGIQFDTTITVTARNSAFTVSSVTSSNPAYDITPKTFTLAAGQSRTLTVSYTPPDSGYTWTRFDFEGDVCLQYYYADGGYPGIKPTTPTLELVEPNGREVYPAGSDTVIQWKGIPPADTVSLDFSYDDGSTWNQVIDKATGGSYAWSVPATPSSTCLMRIRVIPPGESSDVSITLTGHTHWVRSIIWNPGGTMVATAGYDNTVRIWDASNGTILNTFPGPISEVRSIDWSPDGTKLAIVASADKTARILDAVTGTILQTLTGHTGYVRSIKWSPDGTRLATASLDSTARIWNATSGALLKTLTGHTRWVTDVAWSPDGNRVATASWDTTAAIWDVNSGARLKVLVGHSSYVTSVAWSPNGTKVATGSIDYTAKIWDATSGTQLRTIKGHTRDVTSIAWNPDGIRIATASTDSTARIWDANNGTPLKTLIGHISWVNSVAWNPDGTQVATASDDKTARIWDIDPILQNDVSDTLFSIVISQPFSQDIDMGKVLVTTAKDSLVQTFVSNAGGYGFNVRDITISGADASEFALVSGFPPFDVPANGSHPVEFRFQPMSAGVKVASLTVITQTDTLHQSIRGKGITPVLSIVTDLVDFGQVYVGDHKDTLSVITITNIGLAPLSITNISQAGPNDLDFSVLSGAGGFVLPPGDTARLNLRFAPSDVGRTSGRLRFDYNGVGSPATIQLFGEGLAPLVAELAVVNSLIDFGKADVGQQKDTVQVVTITNIGTAPLSITNTQHGGINNMDFMTIAGGGAFTVLPGDTARLDLRFMPTASGVRTGTLVFEYLGTGSPTEIQLVGEGVDVVANDAEATIGTQEIAAFPGEDVEVPILLNHSVHVVQSGATNLTAVLRFNASLLYPIDNTPRGTVSGNDRVIPLELPTTPQTGNVLTTLRFRAMLGNDTVTALTLEQPGAVGGTVAVTVESGVFHLLGVCVEGGARLVDATGQVGILKIRPNPIADESEIDIATVETGHTRVSVMDMLGRDVVSVFDGELATGEHVLPVSTNALTTGSYYVLLMTPTARVVRRVDIVK